MLEYRVQIYCTLECVSEELSSIHVTRAVGSQGRFVSRRGTGSHECWNESSGTHVEDRFEARRLVGRLVWHSQENKET